MTMMRSTAAVRLLAGDKEPVRVASTANLSLVGLLTVDGVVTKTGDRILVKDQTNATENGIYTVFDGTWSRASDASSSRVLISGMKVAVQQGATHAGDVWKLDTNRPNFGDDDISFSFYLNTDIQDDINAAREALVTEMDVIISTAMAAGKATQAEAEAGVSNVGWMSPLRTEQHFAAATATRFPLNRAALKALDTSKTVGAYLREAGREGQFLWKTGDYSAAIAGDPDERKYVKASAIAATAGAWVKVDFASDIDIDVPNSVFKFGHNVYPDRQPHTEINAIHTAQGTVVVGGDNLTGADLSATVSTIIGYRAGEATAANALLYGCDFMGFRTAGKLTDGQYMTVLGIDAAHELLYGRDSVVIGPHAANYKTDIQASTILSGAYAEGTALNSVIIGTGACDNNQVLGSAKAITNSVIIGNAAARQLNVTGTAGSTIIGYNACGIGNLTGGNNTVVGRTAGAIMTTAEQCTFIGDGSGGTATSPNQNSFGFSATCTGSDQVTLGNSGIATLRCQTTSITALSDERDKYDIETLPLGLDFILALGKADAVVRYKWDMRDGARRTDEFEPGVIAQRLAAVEDLFDAGWMGLVDRRNPDRIEATPGKLLFPLIKAVQELSAKVEAQTKEMAALRTASKRRS
ncbi:tail fiber domain-containing protein [Bradyrhizobium japonicum]|uniref:tail fiber domain-containing protein n=1 Tax=Bradyrhizobium japonicum TaxID=375 RepID=UPI00200DD293|nr:tail fiber domain-containing protein [Bradyrhizobium japonicum]UQD69571.1 tail fiber domain-containing protein [Bradyrhizobium japonicum]